MYRTAPLIRFLLMQVNVLVAAPMGIPTHQAFARRKIIIILIILTLLPMAHKRSYPSLMSLATL